MAAVRVLSCPYPSVHPAWLLRGVHIVSATLRLKSGSSSSNFSRIALQMVYVWKQDTETKGKGRKEQRLIIIIIILLNVCILLDVIFTCTGNTEEAGAGACAVCACVRACVRASVCLCVHCVACTLHAGCNALCCTCLGWCCMVLDRQAQIPIDTMSNNNVAHTPMCL